MADLYEQWIGKAEGHKGQFIKKDDRTIFIGGPGGGAGGSGGTVGILPNETVEQYIARRTSELGIERNKFLTTDEYLSYHNAQYAIHKQQLADARSQRKLDRNISKPGTIETRDGKYIISLGENKYMAAGAATLFGSGGMAQFNTRAEAEDYARRYNVDIGKGA
jgi:hypothetical protein